jgi:hypothetical protein
MKPTRRGRPHHNTTEDARSEVRITTESRAVRRQLGPLPWAVLEELALSARPHEDTWVAALGVRAIGAALGVTKDTAARAVATLRSAGIATQVRVRTPDGRSTPAYRLQLPDGISVHRCIADQDVQAIEPEGASVPIDHWRVQIPHRRSRTKEPAGAVQVSLFDDPIPETG